MSFQLAEKALRTLVDSAMMAGDEDAAKRLGEALDTVLSIGGWRAFPVAAPVSETRNKSANALRQERYRAAKRNAQSVTGSVTRNASSVTDGVTGASSLSSSGSENIKKEAEKEEEKREENARDVTGNVTRNARNVTPLRGTRCSPDFTPRDETVTALKADGYVDPLRCLPTFRDYWVSKPGSGGVKLDWDATFRVWVRNEKTMGGASRFASKQIVQPSENRAWKLPEGAV